MWFKSTVFVLILTMYVSSFLCEPSRTLAQSVDTEKKPAIRVIKVSLRDQSPAGNRSLRWSPKAAQIVLTPSTEKRKAGWTGALKLGRPEAKPFQIHLSKVKGSEHPNRLWVDRDRDGKEDRDEIFSCKPNERRKKFWSSFSGVALNLSTGKKKRATRTYPLSFWYVYDPEEPNAEKVLRWSRRGWHQGQFKLGRVIAHIYIAELRMDGIFDKNDSWFLASNEAELFSSSTSRSLDDHAWLGDRAFRVATLDPNGMRLVLEEFKSDTTAAAEAEARDKFLVDKQAPRAEKALAFLKDFAEAQARAKEGGHDLLLDFETTWCGPCKAMDNWVYSAKAVVDKAQRMKLVAVKIDGDEHRDLVKKFKVTAYPTLILLSKDGVEKARAQGYQSIAKLVELLDTR